MRLKKGRDLGVAPAAVAHLRPGIEVLRLAAHDHHAGFLSPAWSQVTEPSASSPPAAISPRRSPFPSQTCRSLPLCSMPAYRMPRPSDIHTFWQCTFWLSWPG